jgi:ABC-type phosphate transport system substrate-binding protein
MKQRVWADGTPITVFILPKRSSEHRSFVTGHLKMQPFHLHRLWNRMIFSGTGRQPTELSSQAEMLDKVRSTPGAIGYLDATFAEQMAIGDEMVGDYE